jgi:hypothetical protein
VKKSSLIILVLLFAFSAVGEAQENRLRVRASSGPPPPNAAQAVYLKWKQEAPADEVSRLRCALATVVTRRPGAEEAEAQFWSVGGVSQTIFEIRPLYVEKLPNGEFKREPTGEMTKIVVDSYGAGNEPGHGFGTGAVFSVKPNTNELEITWTGYLGAKLRNLATIQISLKDEPTSNFTTISGGQ